MHNLKLMSNPLKTFQKSSAKKLLVEKLMNYVMLIFITVS